MKDRFKKVLALALCLTLSASIMSPAFAADNDATQTSPVKLTVQPIVFNVAVPSGLPVDVDSKGEVTVATNVKIENHSAAPISIAGVQVNPIPDWSIVPMNADFKNSKIGTKEFGFILNNDEVPTSGTVALTNSNWPSINGGSSLPLTYNSVVAPQKDAINSNKIADVVFTIGWDVNDFTLSSETLSIEKGSSSKLNLLGVDSAVWSSSNESIATVDQTGNITGLDWGTTTITATANGVSKSCEVTVPKIQTGLELNTNTLSLYQLQTSQLTATSKYRAGTIWSSNNESVATVSSTGLVTGKTPGTTTVTVTQGSFSDSCIVTINPITLSSSTLSVEKGSNATLSLIGADGATWTSSASSVATVDQTGKITAIDWGTTTVSAIIGDFVLSCEVAVPKIQTGLEMNITSKTLAQNETVQLIATSKFRAGVVWTSSNPAVATVDSNGLVTGQIAGITTITANQGGFNATCNITVEPVIGTKYTEGNYEYSYGQKYSSSWANSSLNGWGVRIIDNTQSSYVQPLEEIYGKPVVSYYFLFKDYPNTSLILEGNWTNKNVTDMGYMFDGSQATSLDLSRFNTSNVTNMLRMFADFLGTSLDLSSFDISNVTDMRKMFSASQATTGYARTQADAEKFNTSYGKPSTLTFVVKSM